ncbi:93_t:CDS:1, partial [Gigaspora margarita]
GFYNLLRNKSITANVLYQICNKNFQLLIVKAQKNCTKELSELFNEPLQEL